MRRIRPPKGHVLVEILPEETKSAGGILLPEERRRHDEIGRRGPRRARVLRLGTWAHSKCGRPIPYEFHQGAIVLVDPVLGKELEETIGKRHRIYNVREVLAVETCPAS